jgi:hypothetical protein
MFILQKLETVCNVPRRSQTLGPDLRKNHLSNYPYQKNAKNSGDAPRHLCLFVFMVGATSVRDVTASILTKRASWIRFISGINSLLSPCARGLAVI